MAALPDNDGIIAKTNSQFPSISTQMQTLVDVDRINNDSEFILDIFVRTMDEETVTSSYYETEESSEKTEHSLNIEACDKATQSSDNCICNDPERYGKSYGADLLSVVGALKFLQIEKNNELKFDDNCNELGVADEDDAQTQAFELMNRGAVLGSSRALYNMGVAHDRLKNIDLAKEYYEKAAELGHPLAIYNCAVISLKNGISLMNIASDLGVPEAAKFIQEFRELFD